ncbi:MAG: 25S rRNA (uracil2634-N3)-methyltransferase [Candidatus Deianiraeaceae bacterium]|jgi:25S rRNA (uracil2634-N3)-methyltransferase
MVRICLLVRVISFALSIANEILNPQNIIATTIEIDNISTFTKRNITELINLGATVHLGIDGAQIDKIFQGYKFDNVIFQFPNTGNIQSIEGRHSNCILLRDFLSSAKPLLANNGKVIVTIVDSPYYQGAFQIEEVAKTTGYNNIEFYSFDINEYPNYIHTMTTQNKSVLNRSDKFQTIVFSV